MIISIIKTISVSIILTSEYTKLGSREPLRQPRIRLHSTSLNLFLRVQIEIEMASPLFLLLPSAFTWRTDWENDPRCSGYLVASEIRFHGPVNLYRTRFAIRSYYGDKKHNDCSRNSRQYSPDYSVEPLRNWKDMDKSQEYRIMEFRHVISKSYIAFKLYRHYVDVC